MPERGPRVSPRRSAPTEAEPHFPCDRLEDGTWVYAPLGEVMVVAGGSALVCHACGDALASLSQAHLVRHGMTQDEYRERFGLNRQTSLISPQLAQRRREEGRRRWESNSAVREGLSANHDMARSGALRELSVAATPVGSLRMQGRLRATRDTQPARDARAAEARARWTMRAVELGFSDLDTYLADRRAAGVSTLVLRAEIGCGGSVAERLLCDLT